MQLERGSVAEESSRLNSEEYLHHRRVVPHIESFGPSRRVLELHALKRRVLREQSEECRCVHRFETPGRPVLIEQTEDLSLCVYPLAYTPEVPDVGAFDTRIQVAASTTPLVLLSVLTMAGIYTCHGQDMQ